MAILKSSGGTPANQVKDGLLIVTGVTGATRVQQANNNRSTKRGSMGRATSSSSASFQNMDQVIRNLDAEYELLPDKSPWLTYAENIAFEWNLCANCQPDYGAKKLYRQYNFNRLALGLPNTATPTDEEEISSCFGFNVYCTTNGSGALATCAPEWELSSAGTKLFVQLGLLLLNPVVDLKIAEYGVTLTSGATFNTFSEILIILGEGIVKTTPPEYTVGCCQSTANGAPGLSIYMNFIIPY